MERFTFYTLLRIFAPGLGLAVMPSSSLARPASDYQFDIPAQTLERSIQALAVQSKQQLLFTPSNLTKRKAARIGGRMTVAAALQRLLRGTGLSFRDNGSGVILISTTPPASLQPEHLPEIAPPFITQLPRALIVTAVALEDPVRFARDIRRNPQALDVADLAQSTLGMTNQPVGAGQQGIILRGVGAAGDATTVIYFADVPIAGPAGTSSDSGRTSSDLALIDIEQVAISRSPQGTQHGIGALAGEVEVEPTQAQIGKLGGAASAMLSDMTGGGMGYQLSGVINVPVGQDGALRIIGYDRHAGGYIDNIQTGDKNVNGEDLRGLRLSARYKPDSTLDISALALWQHRRIADQSGWTRALGDYNSDRDFNAPTNHDFGLGRLKVQWRPGAVKLTSISAYYRWKLDRRFARSATTRLQAKDPAGCVRYFALEQSNCDDTQSTAFSDYVLGFVPTLLHVPITITRSTQELRLDNGTAPGLRWRVGMFGDYRSEHSRSALLRYDLPEESGNYLGLREIDATRSQAAMFGTLSHRSSNGALMALGLRYEWHGMSASNDVLVPNVVSGSIQSWPRVHVAANGLHAKMHIDMPAAPWLQFHAQAARSFRPGGVNTASVIPDDRLVYGADRLWGYEMGAKLDLGPALQFTATGYLNDWSNMQYRALSENRSHAYLVNIGDATIRGVEFELVTQPVRGILARLEGSLIGSSMKKGDLPARDLVGGVAAGDNIPFVPRRRLRATLGYRQDLSEQRSLGMEAEWQYQSGQWSTFNRDDPDFLTTHGFDLFAINATFALARTTMTLSVRNIFDTQAVLRAQTNGYGIAQSYSYGPRTVSIGLARNW